MGNQAPDPQLLHEAHEWRLRNDMDDLSADERRDFSAWLAASEAHEAAYDRAITLNAALDTLDPQTLRPVPMQAVYTFAPHSDETLGFRWSPKWIFGALLAGALGVSALVFMPRFEDGVALGTTQQTYQTAAIETRSITLSDGSDVLLGAGSELRVDYGPKRRDIVLLAGAALFDVMSDPERPFTVSAGPLNARAVGTVFDVRYNAGVSRVAVAEGRVRVSYPLVINDQPTQSDLARTLTAGQQIAALNQGLGEVKPIAMDKVGAWRDGRIDYVAAPPAELIADANRYGNVDISLDDPSDQLRGKTISGSFDMTNVDRLLEVLESLLPVKVAHTADSKIVLKAQEK